MSELEEKKKRKKAGTESSKESSLRDWFKRKGAKGKKGGWVDCNAPDGKGGYKSCGRSGGEKRKKYPACRPTPGACKERGRGKSWGKKGSKKKRNESMELSREQLKKIILEELQKVLDEKKGKRRARKKKSGKKDKCYYKVKRRYKVWPSAYASGALSKCRKVGAANWGNKSKKNESLDEEFIPGGESSKYGQVSVEAMIEAIAKEHDVSVEQIEKEFEMGVKEEMEHADEELIAKEIALDHLVEDPEYYTKLERANLQENKTISESLQYHLDHGVGVERNVFRPGSSQFFGIFREARHLFKEGKYKLHSQAEKEIIESDLGEFGMFEGVNVPLDFPMLMEQDEEEMLDEKKKKKKKDPPIGKPMKNSGGGKKYKVYVRNPKTGKVKKISYGDSKGGLKGNWNNAEARKSFASRHNCADKKDRTKAGYWACRAHKDFGTNVPGRFW
jgi:hypothetical protein